jgi:hypothetical protein
MHKLKENLKEKLYDFEEKVERNPKAEMSMQELQKVHLMSDIVKNIDKIEMLEGDEGYSEDGQYMGEGRIYGTSYARGRRNVRRDSMGRYSRDDGMSYDGGSSYARGKMRDGRMGYSRDGAKEHLMDKAEEMLEMTHDPKERKAIEKFMRELED